MQKRVKEKEKEFASSGFRNLCAPQCCITVLWNGFLKMKHQPCVVKTQHLKGYSWEPAHCCGQSISSQQGGCPSDYNLQTTISIILCHNVRASGWFKLRSATYWGYDIGYPCKRVSGYSCGDQSSNRHWAIKPSWAYKKRLLDQGNVCGKPLSNLWTVPVFQTNLAHIVQYNLEELDSCRFLSPIHDLGKIATLVFLARKCAE